MEQLLSRQDIINYLDSPVPEEDQGSIFNSDEQILHNNANNICSLLKWIHGDQGLERFVSIMLHPTLLEAYTKKQELIREENALKEYNQKNPENPELDASEKRISDIHTEVYDLERSLTALFDHPDEKKYLPLMHNGEDPGVILIEAYAQIIRQITDQGLKQGQKNLFQKYLDQNKGTYKPEITQQTVRETLEWIEDLRERTAPQYQYDSRVNYFGDWCRKGIISSIEEPHQLLTLLELTYKDGQRALERFTELLENPNLEEHLQAYCYPKGIPETMLGKNDSYDYSHRYKMGEVIKRNLTQDEAYLITGIMSFSEEYLGQAALAVLVFLDHDNRQKIVDVFNPEI